MYDSLMIQPLNNTYFDVHSHRVGSMPSQVIVNVRFPGAHALEPHHYYSVGLHPWDVDSFEAAPLDWNSFEKLAAHPQVLAVGECGVDRLVNPKLLLRQEECFLQQVNIANKLFKPLIIHQVKAFDLMLSLLRTQASTPWILHGFRGNSQLAKQWLSRGGFLSLGPIFNEDTAREIPMNRLFIETDDSQQWIEQVYKRIAKIRQVCCDELIAIVQQNVEQVFFNR